MVVEDLKPASVYIFQVKQSIQRPKSLKLEQVKEHSKDFSVYISGYAALQVRARTSAGYGAFSRRFEFQTSPYCECTWRRGISNSRRRVFLCVSFRLLSSCSDGYQ